MQQLRNEAIQKFNASMVVDMTVNPDQWLKSQQSSSTTLMTWYMANGKAVWGCTMT